MLVGVGLGDAFVPITSIAVAGVPARNAGVAGGLVNTSQQIGDALGLAALPTLAISRTHSAVATHSVSAALTTGYSWAFLGAAVVAVVAALVAVTAVGRR